MEGWRDGMGMDRWRDRGMEGWRDGMGMEWGLNGDGMEGRNGDG